MTEPRAAAGGPQDPPVPGAHDADLLDAVAEGPAGAAADSLYDIAVIGLAGRFPGAASAAELWQNLRRGVESISFFDDAELLAAGVPRELLAEPAYVRARGVLPGADRFDAALFGFSPREAQIMDPQQRLFLECAWDALGDAACDPERLAGLAGVYAGVSQSSYLLSNLLPNPELLRTVSPLELRLGNDKDFLATAASYRLNLKGPSVTVATACSSSLVAVHFACQGLLNRECDLALAGGVSVTFPQVQGYLHQAGGILSVDGHCRAFDAAASGSVGGDGVGIVVLKRLTDAVRDRDRIRAVIKGSAVNNDGAGKIGFTAPGVEGQAAVIAQAQSAAAVEPESVSYVEAHGSGTPLGDPVEIRALTRAFLRGGFRGAPGSSSPPGAGAASLPGPAGHSGQEAGAASTGHRGWCAVGSVKTNLGHLDAAAGIAGLIKTVLALEHRLIPPSLHFSQANPAIAFAETPFHVAAAATPWESGGAPRRAGVNSFGIGGTNAHVVLEEAPAPASSGPSRPWQLLVVSAATEAGAEQGAAALAAHLEDHPEALLADVAHSGRIGRRALRHRRALVCRSREEAVAALRARDASRLLAASDAVAGRPVAFLLPGVGDHYPGMARGLYEEEAVFRQEVDRAAEMLVPLLGADLRPVLFGGEPPVPGTGPEAGAEAAAQGAGGRAAPAGAPGAPDLRRMLSPRTVASGSPNGEANEPGAGSGKADGGRGETAADHGGGRQRGLDQTALLQPAVFVVDHALARLWESWGVRPGALLGYSLGEYVAACLAGVLPLADALRVVAWRAQRIAELPGGAMLAVALSEAAAGELLVEAGEGGGLSLAAVNAPEQVVVAGPPAAVAALAARLAGRGVACRELPTTHAFHSAMLEPLVAPFARFLAEIELRPPRIPYVTNVTGTWVTERQATDPRHWARHLVQPVRFAAGLATLWQEPATCLLEVGPGHGLTTLARQQAPQGAPGGGVALPCLRPAYDPRPDGAFLLDAVAKVWLAGVEIGWEGFAAGERRNRVPLPPYPFERQRFWIEPRMPAVTVGRAAGMAVAVQPKPAAAAVASSGSSAPSRSPAPPLGAAEASATTPAAGGSPFGVPSGADAAGTVPVHPRPALRTPFVAPRSPREERIAAQWQEILRLDGVGAHDSFFELGGNSLLAPRVLLALRHAFGVEVPLPRLLAEPTVAQVARVVEELATAHSGGPQTAEPHGTPVEVVATAPEATPDLAAEVVLDPRIHGSAAPPEGSAAPASGTRWMDRAGQTDAGHPVQPPHPPHAAQPVDPTASRSPSLSIEAHPSAVLLTGATGFLGPFLLRDLLEQTPARVLCLVRAAEPDEGRERILAGLAAHRLSLPAGAAARIVAVPGDLSARRWGLSAAAFASLAGEAEAVYHAGAWVNFTYPYSALKPANVGGTEEALRLAATGRPKPLHFVSTIAVFPPAALADGVGQEDADLADPDGLAGGYPQSKWVAERLVDLARRRGLPVTIHRPGLIAGDSRTGIGNPRDLLWAFLKGCIQLGAAPELPSLFDPVPVDFVSRSLVHLSRQPASFGRAFHYVHPQPLSWGEVFDFAASLGYPLRRLAVAEWVPLVTAEIDLSSANALAPFRSLFGGAGPPGDGEAAGLAPATPAAAATVPRFDVSNTLAGLAGSSIICPPLDRAQLAIYFDHLVESGFLPPPGGPPAGRPTEPGEWVERAGPEQRAGEAAHAGVP